ncbi:MAG: hypothetical protein JSS68_15165 [Actinobacteria bacterium]|nr:hypothetical protein [Actinomycetota bacterium]
MTSREAQELGVLESVLSAAPLPAANLPADVVAELVRVGLVIEHDGLLSPTRAASHYDELLGVG